jgi:hypothetical protein
MMSSRRTTSTATLTTINYLAKKAFGQNYERLRFKNVSRRIFLGRLHHIYSNILLTYVRLRGWLVSIT